MNTFFFFKKKNVNFKIKFFYYHCFFLHITRKIKRLLILNAEKYTKLKKNLKKIYNPISNIINIIPVLFYDKIFSVKCNMYQRILNHVVIFLKKKNQLLSLIVNKNLKNFTFVQDIKYLYLIYFNKLNYKKKKDFIVSKELFKNFLYNNNFFRNDLLILTKKIIFFTTGQ
nr:hypothetical protein Cry52Nrm3_p018 [Cryptomonas curvata]